MSLELLAPPTLERSRLGLLPEVRPLPRRLSPRRLPLSRRAALAVRAAWRHVMDPEASSQPGTNAVVGWSVLGVAVLAYAVAQILMGGAR